MTDAKSGVIEKCGTVSLGNGPCRDLPEPEPNTPVPLPHYPVILSWTCDEPRTIAATWRMAAGLMTRCVIKGQSIGILFLSNRTESTRSNW